MLGAEREGRELVTLKSNRIRSLRVKPLTPTQKGEEEWGIQVDGGGSVEMMSIKVTARRTKRQLEL